MAHGHFEFADCRSETEVEKGGRDQKTFDAYEGLPNDSSPTAWSPRANSIE